jgi:hypothetical protein
MTVAIQVGRSNLGVPYFLNLRVPFTLDFFGEPAASEAQKKRFRLGIQQAAVVDEVGDEFARGDGFSIT